MALQVTIDPGHGGRDPGAVFEGRRESDDNLSLALAVGEILEENGVDVNYTRTTDVYHTPFEKATMANNAGSDFFLSFHRNSSATPGQYNGAEMLIYDLGGEKEEVAEAILTNLEQVGFVNRGVKERPNLVVLRRTRMPAVLLETGFINNEGDNELFDQQFSEVARAIADGVLSVLQQSDVPADGMFRPVYRVQVGAFRNLESAKALVEQLSQEGYPAVLVQDGNWYKVQVGTFENLDYASMMEMHLKENGYFTWIVTS